MQAAPPRAALRLLGVARSIPLAPLRGLFPVMYVGFWVDALSGLALLSANATGTSATAHAAMYALIVIGTNASA